jgi:hypothetical protein
MAEVFEVVEKRTHVANEVLRGRAGQPAWL